jgi:hypothetical protein
LILRHGLLSGEMLEITRVRTVSSVADEGNEDRNNNIWVQMSHRKLRHGAEGVPQICLLGARYPAVQHAQPRVYVRQDRCFRNTYPGCSASTTWSSLVPRVYANVQLYNPRRGNVIRTDMDTPCQDCSPPWHRMNIHVIGCAYSKARSAQAA